MGGFDLISVYRRPSTSKGLRSSQQPYKMYAKCAIAVILCVGAVLCDNSGYSAPTNSYSAPASGYSAPAPSGYGAPTGGSSYAAPDQGYGAADYGYGYVQEEEEGGLADKIKELLPLFLIVLAAIFLAGLLAPLLNQLFVILVGILPLGLALKAPIVNVLLAPFGLTLCDPNGPTVFPNGGRGFAEEMDLSPETARIIEDTYATLVENLKQYM